jgi:hypothetical protein
MNKNIILFLISLTSFMNPFMTSVVNVAVIEIEKSLRITFTITHG